AATVCCSAWLVSTNCCWDRVTRSAALREFSVFLRAIELISSLDAEVSSSDAACSEDPCASDWLEEETCEAALATCSAPSESSATACRKLLLICWTTTNPTAPTNRDSPIKAVSSHLARTSVAFDCSLDAWAVLQ